MLSEILRGLSFLPDAELTYALLRQANLISVGSRITAGIFTLKNIHFPSLIISSSAESGGKSKLSSVLDYVFLGLT